MRSLILGLIGSAVLVQAASIPVYIGTYTDRGSKGIYLARFDTESGVLGAPELVAETPNPTFLTLDPSGKFLFAANEIGNFQGQKSGSITAYRIDKATGKLTLANSVSSKGVGPCHVSCDKSGRMVMSATYVGGSVASYKVGADGSLSEAVSSIQHQGSGPNKGRQEAAHAHSINPSPENAFAIAADLGTDSLYVYRIDPAAGTLKPNDPPAAKTAPGAGPRHFTFHPNGKWAYAVNELDSTVTHYAWDGKQGVLTPHATVSTLPKDFTKTNSTAEIRVHPNGKTLYASNRGLDAIAVFDLDAAGKPTLVQNMPSGGVMPRNFNITPDGKWLLAANQRTGNVVVFRVESNGRLSETGKKIDVSAAVCLRFGVK
jgi:6-phosphogluconolactonase